MANSGNAQDRVDPAAQVARKYERLPWPLCAGMAAQFAAGGAIIPFVTLLFRERGLDFSQVSLVFVASSATLLVFPFFWGMLADRYVPLNRLFLVLNLVACGALALLLTQRTFTGLLLSYTCYFACFNPALYLMNALSFHHLANPRDQFGVLRAWGSLGWIVPFLPISLWLARAQTTNLDVVVYFGMGCSLLMAAMSFWLPHTPPGVRARGTPLPVKPNPDPLNPEAKRSARAALAEDQPLAGTASYCDAIRRLLSDPNYLVLLGSMFLMAGSFSLMTYYSPALLQEIGVSRPWIGPIQAIGVVFEIVLFQRQRAFLRRWDYSAVVVMGCAALAARHLVFATVTSVWILSASYLLAGVVIVFYNQGVSLLANSMASNEVRATSQTLLLLFGQGLGPLVANALASRLAVHTGSNLRAIFVFAACLACLAALLLAWRGRQLNRAGDSA